MHVKWSFPETSVKTSEKAITLAPAYLDYFLLGSRTVEASEVHYRQLDRASCSSPAVVGPRGVDLARI